MSDQYPVSLLSIDTVEHDHDYFNPFTLKSVKAQN